MMHIDGMVSATASVVLRSRHATNHQQCQTVGGSVVIL